MFSSPLTNRESVLNYLISHLGILESSISDISLCTGGNVNYVWRINFFPSSLKYDPSLIDLFKEKEKEKKKKTDPNVVVKNDENDINEHWNHTSSVILKFMLPYCASKEDFIFSTDRLEFEIESLYTCQKNRNRFCQHIDNGELVDFNIITPKVYYFNLFHNAVIMEDLGIECLELESFIIQKELLLSLDDFKMPRKIGIRIGEFLSKLHDTPSNVCSNIKINHAGNNFIKYVLYDLLLSRIPLSFYSGVDFDEKKENSRDLIHLKDMVDKAISISKQIFENLYSSISNKNNKSKLGHNINAGKDDYNDQPYWHNNQCFIMGDLWPFALLIPPSGKSIGIIDWEFSGLGNPFIDLITFSFWCWILYDHYYHLKKLIISESFKVLIQSFWFAYYRRKKKTICKLESKSELLSILMKQFGVLIILESATTDRWCLSSIDPNHHPHQQQQFDQQKWNGFSENHLNSYASSSLCLSSFPSLFSSSNFPNSSNLCRCKLNQVWKGLSFLAESEIYFDDISKFLGIF